MAYFKNVELDREDFDTEEDYNRALIEQDRIEKINHNVDITDPVVAKTLLDGFLKHPDMFHTIVGTEFLEVLRENTKELMEEVARTRQQTVSEEGQDAATDEVADLEDVNQEIVTKQTVEEPQSVEEPNEPEYQSVTDNQNMEEPTEIESESEPVEEESIEEEPTEIESESEPVEGEQTESVENQLSDTGSTVQKTENFTEEVNAVSIPDAHEPVTQGTTETNESVPDPSNKEQVEKKAEVQEKQPFRLPDITDGRFRMLFILYVIVTVSFPVAGCIGSICLLIMAFIHTLSYYIKDGIGLGKLCVTILYIVAFPIGIILSVIGCMKKVKYVVLNHKLILYGFCLYLLPMMFYLNLSIVNRSAGICIYPWLITLFVQSSIFGKAAMICNGLFLIGLFLYLVLRYMERITLELHELVCKKTEVQPVLLLLDLPIVVLLMFLSLMKVSAMEEAKLS